jgi:hypothetical protein
MKWTPLLTVGIEIAGVEPTLEFGSHLVPVLIGHTKPRGVAIAAFVVSCLPECALVREP